jgi:hypothetical protein
MRCLLGQLFHLRTEGDPEYAAKYLYILGCEYVNPATGNVCDNSAEDPRDECPEEACKAATSWRSFLQYHLSHEYSELIEAMKCKWNVIHYVGTYFECQKSNMILQMDSSATMPTHSMLARIEIGE